MASRPLRSYPVLGRLILGYEDRLTARGRALLWLIVGFAVLGLDTRMSQVYVLFAVAASVFVLAVVIAPLLRARARLEGSLPARATAGRSLLVPFRVTSTKGDRDGLRLAVPKPLAGTQGIRFEPGEQLLAAGPDAATSASVLLRPLRRGRYTLRGPTLRATDPVGLIAGPAARSEPQSLVVYPAFYRMDDFSIPLGRRYQPGGIPLSSSTGDAIEFVGTRDYRDGDPIRNIHWRSWARRGAPVVKEYQEEYFCRIAVVLDTFLTARPRPADHVAFEAAISTVASIADVFSRSEYIVDILAAGPDLYEVSAGRSLAYLENILDVLACLEPCSDQPFATVSPALFDRLAQITTVVAVLQDWDEARETFLRRVRGLGTGVRALVVREGPPSRALGAATDEIGEVDLLAPSAVAAAIAAESSASGVSARA